MHYAKSSPTTNAVFLAFFFTTLRQRTTYVEAMHTNRYALRLSGQLHAASIPFDDARLTKHR